MAEGYSIVQVRGEPLPAGRVGARVRVRLSGCPSGRWSRDVSARLANELVGHRTVGHLRLNEIVQGDQIVLDGVERKEAPALAEALRRAVDATNRSYTVEPNATANVTQAEADEIADEIARGLQAAA